MRILNQPKWLFWIEVAGSVGFFLVQTFSVLESLEARKRRKQEDEDKKANGSAADALYNIARSCHLLLEKLDDQKHNHNETLAIEAMKILQQDKQESVHFLHKFYREKQKEPVPGNKTDCDNPT